MKAADFPCWLEGRHKAVGKALINMGFCYCGLAENFVIFDEFMVSVRGWRLGGAYQESALDAVHDGALFTLVIEDDRTVEAKFLEAKLTINRASEKFNEPLGVQLELPL